jgi:rhodanese-related sulfurtransferase
MKMAAIAREIHLHHTNPSPSPKIMKTLINKLTLSAATLLSMAFAAHGTDLTKEPLSEVQKSLSENKAVLVDVREEDEWKEGHVEGAVFLPLSALKNGVDSKKLEAQIPKGKIIYTHCVVGKRAVAAGNILQKYGYEVRALKQGYNELVAAGFKKAK